MNICPELSSQPATASRLLVEQLMEATAFAIGGPVLRDAGIADAPGASSLIMPNACLLIGGTSVCAACDRATPHLPHHPAELDLLMVRPDPWHEAVFDIRLHGDPNWFRRYLPWLQTPQSGLWLMPPGGEGPHFVVQATGIRTTLDRPCRHDDEAAQRGHARARLLFAVARQGWY